MAIADDVIIIGGTIVVGACIATNCTKPIADAIGNTIDAIAEMCRDDPTVEECEEEWRKARQRCRQLIFEELEQRAGRRKKRSVRGVTGGYSDVEKCATGLVSEACGGNRVER